MSDTSTRLGLPYLMPAQAQKHVTHNEALKTLDLLVQLAIEGFDVTAPPPAPQPGQVWALGTAPTGAWAGQPETLAAWLDGAWHFEPLEQGRLAVDLAAGALRIWDGTGWQSPATPDLNLLDGVGINTSFDATNRLASAAPATLLSHDGAGHQLKINKSDLTDTASLLFQTNWGGRAEMGTTGSDDFSIKVSDDGLSWTDAVTIDAGTGAMSGAAVQADPVDATEDKLLAVGAFGLGASRFLSGSNTLVSRDLQPGFYSYIANTPVDAPENAAWTHNLLVMRNAPSVGNERMAAFAVRTTASSSLRAWVGAQNGAGGTGDPLFWSEIVHQNNMVGPVSQSSGTPTGAVIESGTNANGSYTRWADGTQICTNDNAAITTTPASFTGTITKIDGDKLWIGRWF